MYDYCIGSLILESTNHSNPALRFKKEGGIEVMTKDGQRSQLMPQKFDMIGTNENGFQSLTDPNGPDYHY